MDVNAMRFDLIRGKLRNREVRVRMLGDNVTLTFGRWVELCEELKEGDLRTRILENLYDEYVTHCEEAIVL